MNCPTDFIFLTTTKCNFFSQLQKQILVPLSGLVNLWMVVLHGRNFRGLIAVWEIPVTYATNCVNIHWICFLEAPVSSNFSSILCFLSLLSNTCLLLQNVFTNLYIDLSRTSTKKFLMAYSVKWLFVACLDYEITLLDTIFSVSVHYDEKSNWFGVWYPVYDSLEGHVTFMLAPN